MKFRHILLVTIVAQFFSYAQALNTNLKYPGIKPTLQLEGHLRNPQWSVSGNWLGFDLLKEDMISVVFYSTKTSNYEEYAIKKKIENLPVNTRHGPQVPFTTANTYNVAWTLNEKRDELYVISSLNKKYDIFYIKSVVEYSNHIRVSQQPEPITNNLINKQTSYISFPYFGNENAPGIFIASNELSSEVWLILEESNQTKLTQITRSDDVRKYDPRLSVSENGLIKVAYLGSQGTHTDVFYKPPYNYQAAQNQTTSVINISNTPYAIEKSPRWSQNGKYLAYLSTEGHMNLNNVDIDAKEEDIICGLWVYDIENQTAKEVYYPVGVNPKRDTQSVYAWLPDNQTIIVIDYSLEEKQPLMAVNSRTGESRNLVSPYYHHEDIAVSPDGKKLAIIARGHKEDTDFHYTKLYLADIR